MNSEVKSRVNNCTQMVVPAVKSECFVSMIYLPQCSFIVAAENAVLTRHDPKPEPLIYDVHPYSLLFMAAQIIFFLWTAGFKH